MKQKSSDHLGWFVALSLLVHLGGFSWVWWSLHMVTPMMPQAEPVRVTFVAPDLPVGLSSLATARTTARQQAAPPAEARPLTPSVPSLLSVTTVPTPTMPSPLPEALPQPRHPPIEPQFPEVAIPVTVPELTTVLTPRAAVLPTPTLLIPNTPGALSRTVATLPPLAVPKSATPQVTRPRRRRPAVAAISSLPPPVGQLPAASPSRGRAAPEHFPAPTPSPEAPSKSVLSTPPLALPPPVDALLPSPLSPRQAPAHPRQQEVAAAPPLAKPSAGPAFSPPSAGGQGAASIGGQPSLDFEPHFTYKPCPKYPYMSRRRGAEGVVALRVQILANGTIGSVNVVKSSGHALLDNAARRAVKKWIHQASPNETHPPQWGDVSVNFKLPGSKGPNGHHNSKTATYRNCDPS